METQIADLPGPMPAGISASAGPLGLEPPVVPSAMDGTFLSPQRYPMLVQEPTGTITMTKALRCLRNLAVLAPTLGLLACSNGRGSLESSDGGQQQAPGKVTIGGTVGGLAATGLVLQNNGGDDLTVTGNGSFSFQTAVDPGSAYNVTILTQPTNPPQFCSLANAGGTATANVTTVTVTCSTGVFSVGGMVSGLAGSGLTLRNNGGDDLQIASNGSFTFGTELASGSTYEVTVATQPTRPEQMCTVADAAGTVGRERVSTVRVTCSTNTHSVRGTVSGLQGAGLVLRNNGGDEIGIDSNGDFEFPKALANGADYNVTVKTQPSNPTQACSVENGAGKIADHDVDNVVVACTTSKFTVGGTINGLIGEGLVLANNGGDLLHVSVNDKFTFGALVPSGSPYAVTVETQPTGPLQRCDVSSGSGVVGGTNVTGITISCVTIGFDIGGTLSGLAGSGLKLQNGSEIFEIGANGAFMLPTSLPQGSPYNVTVASQPANPTQVCTVANGSGTIDTADVSNLAVSCVTSSFSVGGSVSGLRGVGLSLRINGGESMFVGNGPFSFPTPLLSGSTYDVKVATQPFLPFQTCDVASGIGTVGGENVTSVTVTCH